MVQARVEKVPLVLDRAPAMCTGEEAGIDRALSNYVWLGATTQKRTRRDLGDARVASMMAAMSIERVRTLVCS